MPVVTCPKCRERYDPGVDDELRDLPANTSLKVVCPKCGQWVRLPENEPVDAPDVPDHVADEMKAQSRTVSERDDRSEGAWGEVEDRPRRRRRDEEDDRDQEFGRYGPTVDQAAEDFSDAPLRQKPIDGLGLASMIVGITSCVITGLGCCCFFADILSLGAGIAAVVLGFMARKRPTASVMALIGLITGFIAIAVSLGWLAFNLISLLNGII
ncbi:MAG TPA: hypothetical protein VHR66_28435 [Gemmataceae bacterium]|jgi:hypothetical protein|nr:hypothetical protein [Gemmataceae bacterium]